MAVILSLYPTYYALCDGELLATDRKPSNMDKRAALGHSSKSCRSQVCPELAGLDPEKSKVAIVQYSLH